MKFEKIKHILAILLSSIILKRINRFYKLFAPPFHKLSFLCLSIFCFISLTGKDTLLINQHKQVSQIVSIPDDYERAISWYIHVYKTSLYSPKNINQQLPIGETLWPQTPTLKQAIYFLTQAEIAKISGKYEHTTNKVAKAIQLLEIKNRPTLSQKKMLSLAYISYARFSKYTKEKEGLNYAYKALALADEIKFTTGRVLAHEQIGLLIGYFKKDYSVALDHFTQAKEHLNKLPKEVRNFREGFILGNIAKAWSDLGDIEKSITYKLEVLEKEKLNLELLLGTNNNLGTNYYELKQYDLAEKHLKKTLDLMEANKVYTNKGIPLLRLGLIHLQKKNLLQAGAHADMIDYWLIKHKFIGNYQVSFYQFKSKIAKANKDFEQAIFWIEKASIEQNSINEIAGINHLIKLEKSVKLKEIKQEQLILEKELALNKATIKTQNIILIAISFLTILSIWFGISFYEKTRELKEAYNFILRKNSAPIKIRAPVIKEKNNNSNTSKKINEALKEKIIHALEVDKIFLSSDLTLKKFSDQLSSNTSYVSQTINEGCGKNFSTLINEYRIKEVLRFFEEGQHQLFTIESLYKKAGFKSKSAFQKAFKNSKGVTASYYLEHISQFSNSNNRP